MRNENRRERKGWEDISGEEVRNRLRKMKKGKAQ